MKLRVGLVGLGEEWDRRHRAALRALSDRFEVRAVYEQVAQRAASAARDFDAKPVEGYHALAQREDVDAVLMLSQNWHGTLPIFAACEAGKDIYSATGLGTDLVRADVLKKRIEASGVMFMAESSRRHAPATNRLKELIVTRLGEPRLLFCHRRKLLNPATNGTQRGSPTDATTNEMIEIVDWCRFIVGAEPSSVFALHHLAQDNCVGNDYEMMSLDFSPPGSPRGSGAVAQISQGSYIPHEWSEAVNFRVPADLQVTCQHGIAFVDLPSKIVWFDSAGRHQESLDSERPLGEALLSQFYRGVTSLVRNSNSLEDTYRALKVVMSAYDSKKEGLRIELH